MLRLGGTREAHGEIQLPPRSPAARFTKPGHRAVRTDPDARPQYLPRIVINTRSQVDQYVRRLVGGEGVSMQSNTGGCRQLRPYAVVREGHRVVARLRLLRVVTEPRPISRQRFVRVARLETNVARNRLGQYVTEIRVSGAGKMGV